MFEAINTFVQDVDDFVWDWWMILLLLGTHIFMTIRTGGIQRKVFKGIKLSVTKDPEAEGEVSQFGALTTALAATIGTGNIIGVGTAIALGGPGAVLWCWLTGVFGIATKYSEALISVKYRVKTRDGRMLGGAMYALERGLKLKWLGILFAVFGGVASFGIGCATQVNAIASVCRENLGIPPAVVGIVVAVLVALVIFGGLKSISSVCEKLVPFMAIFYVLGCLIILIINYDYLLPALQTIVTLAFKPGAAAGGLVGGGIMQALHYGVARGLFSNESGMGSAPLVASSATTKNPARQALVSMTGTFWDTVVVCLITGLMLMTTLLANPELSTAIANGTISSGAGLATAAFEKIPVFGPLVLLVGLITFTYSTILGWSQYGNRAISYLLGKKAVLPYYIVFLLFVFWGCMMVGGAAGSAAVSNLSSVVWNVADVMNALMAIPNCIAVLGLSAIIARETKHYVYDNNLEEVDKTEIPQYHEK